MLLQKFLFIIPGVFIGNPPFDKLRVTVMVSLSNHVYPPAKATYSIHFQEFHMKN
jgi:hypothetical protein